jgi:predicted dehydrogenase
MTPLNVVIVGCGVIATPYAEGFADFPTLRLHVCFDVDASKRDAFAAAQGCRPYPSLEAALADPDADLIVNLTVLPAHYDVTKRALEAGKHVFSEKPLAASSAQAQELVALARDRGVRLGCAPVTHLGHAQQRAGQELRAGRIGPVRVIYAEANHARIETWHGAPHSFYRVGPLRDVGVYPLGVITSIFGPARRVWAYGTAVKPERVTKRGEPFEVEAPDWYVAVIELATTGSSSWPTGSARAPRWRWRPSARGTRRWRTSHRPRRSSAGRSPWTRWPAPSRKGAPTACPANRPRTSWRSWKPHTSASSAAARWS